MFGSVIANKFPQFLVDFVVLMMLVHPPHIVQDVFGHHFTQLFVLDVALSQQKLYGTHRVQDVLGSQNHHCCHTLATVVRMQCFAQLIHETHHRCW